MSREARLRCAGIAAISVHAGLSDLCGRALRLSKAISTQNLSRQDLRDELAFWRKLKVHTAHLRDYGRTHNALQECVNLLLDNLEEMLRIFGPRIVTGLNM